MLLGFSRQFRIDAGNLDLKNGFVYCLPLIYRCFFSTRPSLKGCSPDDFFTALLKEKSHFGAGDLTVLCALEEADPKKCELSA